MILRDTQNRTQEGNLQGETITMGISDIRLIIDRLTDLYQDRELACIREYSTNGRDAHIEAGITCPIEVSTPTALSPFLTIRDFGIGLSLEDIRAIYSQYGASTKRNTNDQTGALGLGCKSALSYSDQFTVTSVKDGVRIQVVVSRDPKMGATMKVVDTSDTDEPNGTTVIIPARADNRMEQKARNFFRFWQKGTVKLNGHEPEVLPDAKWIADDLAILSEQQSYVVMGGVPYPSPDLHRMHGLGWGQGVAVFVPIGAVDFAPSREGLMDTDATTATIRKARDDVRTKLTASITKDIQDAPTAREAIKRRLAWRQKVPTTFMPDSVRYKGKEIPTTVEGPKGTIHVGLHGRKMTSFVKIDTEGRPASIESASTALWVTGWDHASFTATSRKKLDKYVEDNGLAEVGSYILTPGAIPAADKVWMGDVAEIDWPTVKAIKLPRNTPQPNASGRIPGSYDIYEDGDFNEGVPGDDIDTSNPVFWMFGKYHEGSACAERLKAKHPGCTLVMLRRGREDKFKRNFPNAKEATQVIAAEFKVWKAGLKKDDQIAYAVQNDYHMGSIDYFDASKVDDPEVKHAISVRKRDLSAMMAEIKEWQKVGCYYDCNEKSLPNPLRKYPLLPDRYDIRSLMRNNSEHVYRYMNHEFLHQAQKAAS